MKINKKRWIVIGVTIQRIKPRYVNYILSFATLLLTYLNLLVNLIKGGKICLIVTKN